MDREKPLTFGDWMITILILTIPFVNIVALIFWAVSPLTNTTKQNYARASIVWVLIGFVVVMVLSMTGVLADLVT